MNMRIRSVALSAIAIVTAGLLNITGAAPAQAAEGQTCKDPIITGTVKRVVGESATIFKPVYAEFSQTGYTDANCPTTFTDYRYKVTFTYDGRTVSSYQSAIEPVYTFTPRGAYRSGTKIVFPDLRLSWAGYKNATITVTSGSKSVFESCGAGATKRPTTTGS